MGLYGLNKFFLNPFSIVNVGAMNDTPKNLKYMVSWPVISSRFTYKTHVDHGQDGSLRSTCADTMADMNILANDAPAEPAHDVTPPTRTDDQILLSSKWVPIGKSNCVLDA
uniref:Uncharacterized protein n=1 Tax=Tanacetum cinerariifolium TaxID=118510 RepID=A0A699TLG1_TANCI|nr:hypothetical protein [Tanacetum cinerariifolium]